MRVPDFEAIDTVSKEAIRLYDLPSVPRVMAFVTTTCMSCRAVLEGLNEVAATRRKEFDFLVVCHDNVDSCAGLAELASLKVRTVADPSGKALEAFQAAMTPFVYLVDAGGHVLIRGIANDWRGVESLLNEEGTLQGTDWTEIPELEAEGALTRG
jgi:peroxiredoxin